MCIKSEERIEESRIFNTITTTASPLQLYHVLILILLGVIVILFLLIESLDSTDLPHIPGLPEVLGWPIFGSVFQFGDNHCKSLSKMVKTVGSVCRIRLGNKRIVVAKAYDSIKRFCVKNQAALISRSTLHTFHNVVSTL